MPEPESLDDLLERAFQELQEKSAVHKATWGMGTFDRFDVDLDTATLVFQKEDGFTATCGIQVIGSYSVEHGTWLWAYANPSIPENITEPARKVLQFGRDQGIEELTWEQLNCDEDTAWRLAALGVMLNDSQAAYRAPGEARLLFLAIETVKLGKAK